MSKIVLSCKLKVADIIKKRKSKFPFWQNVSVGDILTLTHVIDRRSKEHSGVRTMYASWIMVKNERSLDELEFSTTELSEIGNYLEFEQMD